VDALARGAAIACPDYPLLRRQLTWPEPVGALYADVDGLAAAIDQALALGASLPAARAAHVRERGAAAIAAILDGYAGLAEEAEGTG